MGGGGGGGLIIRILRYNTLEATGCWHFPPHPQSFWQPEACTILKDYMHFP